MWIPSLHSAVGYVIGQDGIQMDQGKVKAIREWPLPRTVKDLQWFLGFADFYRCFIKNCSMLTAREARARSAAFKTFIPRRSRSKPEQSRGPGPSWFEDQRRAQKASVVTCAPPPPAGRARRMHGPKRGRQALREVIEMKRSQHLFPSLGGPLTSALSNSPATTIYATWPRLGGNLRLQSDWTYDDFGQVLCSSKLPYWWSGPEASSEVSVGTSLIFRSFWSALQSPDRRVLIRTGTPLTVSCPEGPPAEGFTSHVGPATDSAVISPLPRVLK